MGVIGAATEPEQAVMQLQGHAGVMVAAGNVAQAFEARVVPVIVAAIQLAWPGIGQVLQQAVAEPFGRFVPGGAHGTGLVGEAMGQGQFQNALDERIVFGVQDVLQGMDGPVHRVGRWRRQAGNSTRTDRPRQGTLCKSLRALQVCQHFGPHAG